MTTRLTIAAVAFAAGLACAAMPGSATPAGALSPLKQLNLEQSSIVEKTHGWHRKCRRGLNGWHRHVRGVGRVQCTTARNCYYNIFGVKVCNWS